MPIDFQAVMDACDILARQDNLNICIQESLKGAALAGLGSFLGGMVLGPPGIAVGAAVGGLAGASACRQYKPIVQVIQEMNEAEKRKLATHMQRAIAQLDISDAVLLMTIIRDPTALGRDALVKELGAYFGQTLVSR